MVSFSTMTSSINCPACGGPIDSVNPLSRSLVCSHCGNLLQFDNSSWLPKGTFSASLDAPPLLRTGRTGKLAGRPFTVDGRVRLQTGTSHWDEWWLSFDDGEGQWVEEDDGQYLLHESLDFQGDTTTLGDAGPGQMLNSGNESWFITEKGEAQILAVEGQLPVSMSPGFKLIFLDAVAGGRELAIEIWLNEVSASVSHQLSPNDIQWTDM